VLHCGGESEVILNHQSTAFGTSLALVQSGGPDDLRSIVIARDRRELGSLPGDTGSAGRPLIIDSVDLVGFGGSIRKALAVDRERQTNTFSSERYALALLQRASALAATLPRRL
jgi:hypothetical protein